MAYIGKTPITGNFVKLDAISVVNGQAGYTMNNGGSAFTDYENVNQFLVSLNGILQAPTDSFTVSGSTLTFASNLATGDVIDFVIVLGNTLDIGTPSDATVTQAKTNFVSTSSSAGLQIKGDNTTAGTLQLNCEQNSHGIKLRSPPHSASASYTLTFPNNDGDADQFLQTNGSGVMTWADAGGGQYTKIHTENITSATGSVVFTSSHFTSTYDDYLLVMNTNNATSAVKPQLNFSTDNGSSYVSGMDYFARTTNSDNTNAQSNSGNSSSAVITGNDLDNASQFFHAFNVHLINMMSSSKRMHGYGHGSVKITNTGSQGNNMGYTRFAFGETNSTQAYNNMKFSFTSGNIDAGTFVLYGRNK